MCARDVLMCAVYDTYISNAFSFHQTLHIPSSVRFVRHLSYSPCCPKNARILNALFISYFIITLTRMHALWILYMYITGWLEYCRTAFDMNHVIHYYTSNVVFNKTAMTSSTSAYQLCLSNIQCIHFIWAPCILNNFWSTW